MDKQIEFHPYATIFPLLDGEDFAGLVADVKANGLHEAVVLYEGQILDGRNRYRACQEAGVEPRFESYVGAEPLDYVWSLNLERRHLDAGQKAFAALEYERHEAERAKKRQVTSTGGAKPQLAERIPEADKGEAREKAARKAGVNPHYVSDAKKIERVAPDKAAAIKAGKKTIPQAKREIKEAEAENRRAENIAKVALVPKAERVAETLQAKFATIVIDPPWSHDDEGDKNQFGRTKPKYKTLTIDELLALPVGDFADKDCHIYMWITNRSLPKGFGLLERWGFRYITCVTWVKPRFGVGNYFRGQTEHVLFGVKGHQLLKRKDASTVLNAPRGPDGHSSKPVEFLPFVESCSPGPYLEMFSRREREGWVTWGENYRNADAA